MNNVIVTGATGFVGSWLVKDLLEHNMKVTIIVRDIQKVEPQILQNEKCIVIEKCVEEMTGEDFDSSQQYDVFYHFAWAGVAPGLRNDVDLQMKNVSMSLKALEVCNKIGCKKFIAAGTVAEYALCNGVMDYEKVQMPNDMYGAAKVSAYHFLKVRARQLSQPFIWMILPSTFGEGRSDGSIINYTIDMLTEGKRPQYGNLMQMWDFLYVSEVARAIRMIGERGIEGKTYGVGSGQYRPLAEYIKEIRDVINPDLELGIGERTEMSSRTTSSCVDIYELTKDTGFVPVVSFADGIRKTVENQIKV